MRGGSSRRSCRWRVPASWTRSSSGSAGTGGRWRHRHRDRRLDGLAVRADRWRGQPVLARLLAVGVEPQRVGRAATSLPRRMPSTRNSTRCARPRTSTRQTRPRPLSSCPSVTLMPVSASGTGFGFGTGRGFGFASGRRTTSGIRRFAVRPSTDVATTSTTCLPGRARRVLQAKRNGGLGRPRAACRRP